MEVAPPTRLRFNRFGGHHVICLCWRNLYDEKPHNQCSISICVHCGYLTTDEYCGQDNTQGQSIPLADSVPVTVCIFSLIYGLCILPHAGQDVFGWQEISSSEFICADFSNIWRLYGRDDLCPL